MDDGVTYAEHELKPIINEQVDELVLRAQNIAYSQLIDDKLAALRQAGEDLKVTVNEKVDCLIAQTCEKRPDRDDPLYEEKAKIYHAWLDQVTEGIHKVHSFFNRIWSKLKDLLDKIFRWIRDGVDHLVEKIANAFRIVRSTLAR